MSVQWLWEEDSQAHVLRAIRAVSAGHELLQSYGNHSNTGFYRCYNFTLHPQLEVTWCYSLWRDDILDIFNNFVPEGSFANTSEIHLSTSEVSQSLRDILTEIAANGANPAFFVRLACTALVKRFADCSRLQPVLESLKRSRDVDPTCCAWWQHLEGEDAAMVDDNMVRIWMSDYLCLVAYLEAISFAAGEVQDSQCLSHAIVLRHQLRDLLFALHGVHNFK
jgi:hypothetical protein